MFHKRVKRLSSESLTLQVIGSGLWAGVDSAWEQKKPEARKMLENAAESHTSGARFVSPFSVLQDFDLSKTHTLNM